VSDSFGRRLRIERERRKIPLTSIVDNTKISITLLEGLERDDLSRWPTGIFRRSFLRVYAEALGLDAEPLLCEFLTLFPDPTEPHRDVRGVDASPPADESLRLTLAESWSPFAGGLRLVRARKRWTAAAWDLAVLIAVAAGVFVVFGKFWLPLGIASLFYYVGGILVFGNTPGVCLFGLVPSQDDLTILAERSDERDLNDRLVKKPPKNRRNPLRVLPALPNSSCTRQRRARLAACRSARRWQHRGDFPSGSPAPPLRTPRRVGPAEHGL
jgi:transcriptional regulator with XRE-family HTH domain